MPEEDNWHRYASSEGVEYWVDESGVVTGRVVTEKPREDAKLYSEDQIVRGLLESWGWPTISFVTRPQVGTYDFDCSNPDTGEVIAIEVKAIVGPNTLGDLSSNVANTESFKVRVPTKRGWEVVFQAQLTKADRQLSQATSPRRVALLNPLDQLPNESALREALCTVLLTSEFEHIDEIWVSPRLGQYWLAAP